MGGLMAKLEDSMLYKMTANINEAHSLLKEAADQLTQCKMVLMAVNEMETAEVDATLSKIREFLK
jgi:hypothetical protein